MSTPVAQEIQGLFYEVARDADPRATVKAKLRFICQELGYPDGSWRVHDGFYGRARNWSYAAVRDTQDRVKARRERRAKLAAEQAATKAFLAQQRDAAALAAARAEHLKALAQIELRLAAMGIERGDP